MTDPLEPTQPSTAVATGPELPPPEPAPLPVRQPVRLVDTGGFATIQSLIGTITIAVFVITFIIQAFTIPSESMEKTLLIGD
jgi:signal peptidase I